MRGEFYLQPPEFFDEVLASRRQGKVSDKLAKMFITLSERMANHVNYNRYFWLREDIIAVAQMACCVAFHAYNPYRKPEDGSPAKIWDGEELTYHHTLYYSPFSWFTKCAENDIIEFLRRYYKAKNAVNSTKMLHGLEPDPGFLAMLKKQADKKAGIEHTPETESIETVLSLTDNTESAGIRYSKLIKQHDNEIVDEVSIEYVFSEIGNIDEPDEDGFVYKKNGDKVDQFGIIW